MHKLSLSRAGIAVAGCVWWARDGLELPPDPPGPPARIGSAFHAGASLHVRGHVPHVGELAAKFELDDELRARLNGMLMGWISRNADIRRDGWKSEPAYAIDAAAGTARLLGHDIGRNYKRAGLLDHEIPGAADLVRGTDGHVVVRDLKTGSADNVEPVRQNAQLRALAFAAAHIAGANVATVELEFVDGDGGSTLLSDELDEFELLAVEADLRDAWTALHGAPEPKPGPHCKWCPARTICPANQNAASLMAPPGKALQVVVDAAAFTGPQHAAEQVQILKRARVVLDAADGACKAYADAHGGIPTRYGYVWAGEQVNSERVNKKALRIAAERLAEATGRTVAQEELYLLEAARAGGGITTSRFPRYEERKAR